MLLRNLIQINFNTYCVEEKVDFLYKSNPRDAYQLGYLTRMYIEKVKKEYPELYNNQKQKK